MLLGICTPGQNGWYLVTDRTKLSNPLSDVRAALFLDAAFVAPKALIDGKSVNEAVELTQNAFRRSIQKALNSDIQSDNDKCVSYLWWDLKHLKCIPA